MSRPRSLTTVLLTGVCLIATTLVAPGPAAAAERSPSRHTVNGTTYEAARTLPAPPRVRSRTWAVADLRTGELLAVHRPRKARQPASTLKLLTALTAVRTVSRGAHRVTRRQARATCVCVGLRPGREYTRGDLLDALLLPSANDAAKALAGAHPRGRRGFLRAMKRRADRLGLASTTAVNPHGLTARGNGTSPRDLLVLLRTALRTRPVARHLHRSSARFGPVGGPTKRVTRTNAYVERFPRARGKTGFTSAARYNLVVATPMRIGPRGGGPERRIIAATMGSPTREASVRATRRLSRWVADHHRRLQPVGRLPRTP